ncbi:hypothetical protein DPMN_141869 [Dreissena polymorpha]|uniref:Uncharacterized protein n=1 Tax=Dreissena polymorpha TaxID=45954 RepID=A0A9D4GAK5_DREPO|nr:hypothetical protein DPMN_141869 [Dreissena polymorpha]
MPMADHLKKVSGGMLFTMATNGPFRRMHMVLVFGLLSGTLGHAPINEEQRSVAEIQCGHVCHGAQSCVHINHDGRFYVRCVRPDGTEPMVQYEEPEVIDVVEIERIVQTMFPQDGEGDVLSAQDVMRELMQPQVHTQHTEVVRPSLIREAYVVTSDQPQEIVHQREQLLYHELVPPSVMRQNAVQVKDKVQSSVVMRETFQPQTKISTPEMTRAQTDVPRAQPDVPWAWDVPQRQTNDNRIGQLIGQPQEVLLSHKIMPNSVIRQDAVTFQDKVQYSLLTQETVQPQARASPPEIVPATPIIIIEPHKGAQPFAIAEPQEIVQQREVSPSRAPMTPSLIRQDELQFRDKVKTSLFTQETVQPQATASPPKITPAPLSLIIEPHKGAQPFAIAELQEIVQQHEVSPSRAPMTPSLIRQDELQFRDKVKTSLFTQETVQPQATASPPKITPAPLSLIIEPHKGAQPFAIAELQEIVQQHEVSPSHAPMTSSVIKQVQDKVQGKEQDKMKDKVQDKAQDKEQVKVQDKVPGKEQDKMQVKEQDKIQDILQSSVLMQESVQPQATTLKPEIIPANQDIHWKDVRHQPLSSTRIRHALQKALQEFKMRPPNIKHNVRHAVTPKVVIVSQRPVNPADKIRMTPEFKLPSGNPQCEYCKSADQCKDETRPYCYHSHACARRVCQSL